MDNNEVSKIAWIVALNKVQGMMEPVKKDATNPHFKSRYATLAAVNEAIMGPLAESGFVITSGGVDVGGKPYLRTTLWHVKGHSESFDYPLVVDANPQHLASCTTYARRYSLCAWFNLSTNDDDGNMAATPVKSYSVPVATSKPTTLTSTDAMDTAEFVPVSVDVKTGEKNGKTWTKWAIKAPDGKYYGTFNEEMGHIASEAAEMGVTIAVRFKFDGKYYTVISLSELANA